MIALGIDPGTATIGFGVVALERDDTLRLVDAGCIRTTAAEPAAARLAELHRALRELIEQHAPQRVAVERVFFQRNVRTAMQVGEARGIALLAAAEHALPVDDPTPNEVKQAVCGNGAADKEQVRAMVARLLGVKLGGVPDDASDALAVAIGCLYRAAGRVAALR